MGKWFLNSNENVKGPFSEDEIKAQVASGTLPAECLIWGRPHNNWQSVSGWMKDAHQVVTATFEPKSMEQMWHYAVDGVYKGPMSRPELVNELKSIRQKDEILVWTKGMKAWTNLYEFHDLLDEIGLNRREHPRAQIQGTVVFAIDGRTTIGQLKVISAGGFGASQLEALAIGQTLSVEIKSIHFGKEPIAAKATVQYSTDSSGYYGFKFQNLSMESRALIMEYIKSAKPAVDTAA